MMRGNHEPLDLAPAQPGVTAAELATADDAPAWFPPSTPRRWPLFTVRCGQHWRPRLGAGHLSVAAWAL